MSKLLVIYFCIVKEEKRNVDEKEEEETETGDFEETETGDFEDGRF